MNTAARDRALLHTVEEYFKGGTENRRTPVTKLALSREKDGALRVALHTSRPNTVRMEANALTQAIRERIGGERTVRVEVVPEARAVAKFVRTSPRKARLVIDVIKGKRVSEALAMLRFIPNHAAELISKVLVSAAANAQDGWGAGVEELKVVNILADGGPSLKRVRARAQGRAYRILKRTSHLTVILSEAPAPVSRPRRAAAPARPKTAKAPAAPRAQRTPNAPAQTAPDSGNTETTSPATTTEQAGTESNLDAPLGTTAEQNRQAPRSGEGQGSTGDTAGDADTGVSAAPEEATPVSASDAPEEANH